MKLVVCIVAFAAVLAFASASDEFEYRRMNAMKPSEFEAFEVSRIPTFLRNMHLEKLIDFIQKKI